MNTPQKVDFYKNQIKNAKETLKSFKEDDTVPYWLVLEVLSDIKKYKNLIKNMEG